MVGMEYNVELSTSEAQHAAVLTAQVEHTGIPALIGRAFGQTMSAMQAQGIHPVGPPFARYEMAGSDFIIDAGFPCSQPIVETAEVHDIELPAGPVATTMHVGAYDTLVNAYNALESWMTANGYAPAGGPWEVYLDGPEVAEPRTIVTWPCVLAQ